MEEKSPTWNTIALTAVPAVVWGSTYAVTQLWLPADRPFFAATARVLPAGLLLLLWVRRLPRGRWWGRSVVLGALNHGLFFGLLYLAAFRLPSGLASTLTALSPLVVMGMAFLVIGERQPRVTLIAALVGVAGVVTLVWQNDRSGTVDCRGRGRRRRSRGVIGARLRPRQALVTARRRARHDVLAAGRRWPPARCPSRPWRRAHRRPSTCPPLLPLAYLGLVGSALGYVLWFRGLTRMDAGAVAVVGLVNPVVGTALGVLLLSEPFGPVHLVAVVVTLGSVLVAQGRCAAASAPS